MNKQNLPSLIFYFIRSVASYSGAYLMFNKSTFFLFPTNQKMPCLLVTGIFSDRLSALLNNCH